MRDAISNAVLLIDEGIEIAGLKVWGSPVTPLYGGAFGMSKAEDRKRHWAQVPEETDILITHGPPFGILDHAPGSQQKEGCPELLEADSRASRRERLDGLQPGTRECVRVRINRERVPAHRVCLESCDRRRPGPVPSASPRAPRALVRRPAKN